MGSFCGGGGGGISSLIIGGAGGIFNRNWLVLIVTKFLMQTDSDRNLKL